MADEQQSAQPRFEPYLHYLQFLARQIHYRFKSKFDPSDVVQDTVLRLMKGGKWPPGTSEEEYKAYVAVAFRNALRDKLRALEADKRAPRREISLEGVLHQSSAALSKLLIAEQSSPSQRAIRNEGALRVAWALGQLPEHLRKAIELRDVQNWTVAAITEELKCSRDDLARYLRIARRKLSELIGPARAEEPNVS